MRAGGVITLDLYLPYISPISPLYLQVRDGDVITLDPKARSLSVDISDAELALRRAAWQPRPRKPNTKGVLNNYARHAHCSTLVCA